MSGINEGIKQPLRFYDSAVKQNFRREWIHKSGLVNQKEAAGVNCVICPNNVIIPFQIRRIHSMNPVTVFDLIQYDSTTGGWTIVEDLFNIIPAPYTDHLRIVQMQQVDNILWNPKASFTSDIDCGLYYVHVSDSVSSWYSEVFEIIDYDAGRNIHISLKPPNQGVLQTTAIAWTVGPDTHYINLGHKAV
ncbi:MAG: hypothetical protein V1904_01125 [Bacteroidota bacterium]